MTGRSTDEQARISIREGRDSAQGLGCALLAVLVFWAGVILLAAVVML